MDIRNTRALKSFSAERLTAAPDQKRIVLIYTAIVIGLNILTTLFSYVLGLRIDQYGGLSNMSTRSTLSAIQTMLPVVQTLIAICLELGYVAAMLRIARGQYASPNTLRLGFDRFWVLLRSQIILILLYAGICIASIYLASILYMLSPLSSSFMEIVMPLMSETTILDSGIMLDDAMYAQLISAMIPVFLIFAVIFLALYIPISYRFRMTGYVIIDKPGMGAIAALRESRKMMRGNAIKLFKLDISFWWYYAALAGISVICYGDQILPMLGVEFPFSADIAYFIFYGLYWALQFATYYFLRNRLEVSYALAYDAIKPEEKQDNGVVLGNIFQM